MIIKGFQKLTLLDYPEKTACTIFTGGCNFRCPFCHNASLVISPNEAEDITEDEIFSLLSKRQGILDGVCITGGEPLLQSDIAEFMRKIKDMGFLIKLDTNGTFPEKLEQLIDNGLCDYVAMDIKNSPEKYAKTAGLDLCNVSDIEKSIHIIMTKAPDYEFRTTVVKDYHDGNDFTKIGEMIRGAKKYYLQSFVDSGNLIKNGLSGYDKSKLETFKSLVKPYVERVEIRGV